MSPEMRGIVPSRTHVPGFAQKAGNSSSGLNLPQHSETGWPALWVVSYSEIDTQVTVHRKKITETKRKTKGNLFPQLKNICWHSNTSEAMIPTVEYEIWLPPVGISYDIVFLNHTRVNWVEQKRCLFILSSYYLLSPLVVEDTLHLKSYQGFPCWSSA